MGKRKTADLASPDPMLPFVEIAVKGRLLKLAFTFGALGVAQAALRKAGSSLNLLQELSFRGIEADNLPVIFFAALRPFHPEIGLPEAEAMIDMQNFAAVYVALVEAYMAVQPKEDEETKKGDPQQEPAN